MSAPQPASLQTPPRRGREYYRVLLPAIRVLEGLTSAMPLRMAAWLLTNLRYRGGIPVRALRYGLVRRLAKSAGEMVDIRETVFIYSIQNISFGDRVSIHPMCYIDGSGGISIGSDVSIAHATTIVSTNHSFEDSRLAIRDQPVAPAPVSIGDDVWIGAGVRILAGVSIGSGAVIAAGSVVIRDIPDKVLAAGVPATVRRWRGES